LAAQKKEGPRRPRPGPPTVTITADNDREAILAHPGRQSESVVDLARERRRRLACDLDLDPTVPVPCEGTCT